MSVIEIRSESSRTLSPTEGSVTTNSQNTPIMVTQKTNHVSTVLLYGIPIVSLHIEGQERLCLAQISNTLLKAYSYNEIHNRRVALGITCVQCTPVQLEILRRAGAMPVSSRRCGMITRREAERLCKSFLGDNSPPRLPEDFAFSVQHKCAWGCRGSFLPARYNSSRAKCIKCSFCGMFFSPNKFIFHSHRMSASDKYVQPDAANFNSWRRHMVLNGKPPEEIVHAWEDVKAMFNGGTRKRLLHTGNNSINSTSERSIQSDKLATVKSDDLNLTKRQRRPSSCVVNGLEEESVEKKMASNIKVSYESAESSRRPAILVSRQLQQFQPEQNSLGLTSLPTISGFSSQFMVDYMLQAQHQHQNQKAKTGSTSTCSSFSFPNCPSLPWLKSAACPPFKSMNTNENYVSSSGPSSLTSPHYPAPNLLTTSAFKPVLQQHLQQQKPTMNAVAAAAASFVSSSMYTCSATSISSSPLSPSASMHLNSFAPTLRHFAVQHATKDHTLSPLAPIKDPPFSDDEENDEQQLHRVGNKDDEDDDEIEVDIETTEDDTPPTTMLGKVENKLSPQIDLQFVRSEDVSINHRDQKQILSFPNFDIHSNHLSGSGNTKTHTDQQQTPITQRMRHYSCSSSNDSLYMSVQNRSETEGSSRATSTASIEILNEESSNIKMTSQQNPLNNSSIWKEFSVTEETGNVLSSEENSKRSGEATFCDESVILSQKVMTSCEMNLQKMKSIKSVELSHQHDIALNVGVPVTDSVNRLAKVSHTPSALFDAINVNSNKHFLTSISNPNKNLNTYGNELWHVASLCLHRPMSHEVGSAYNNSRLCLATSQQLNTQLNTQSYSSSSEIN